MSFETLVIILTIISLLLQVIGILVALVRNTELDDRRDNHKKGIFKPINNTSDKLKTPEC